MRVDWSKESTGKSPVWRTGIYLVEVMACVEGETANGAPKLTLELAAVDFNYSPLCKDILSFGERAMGISAAKLSCLGVPKTQEEVTPGDVVSRRAFVFVAQNEYVNSRGESRINMKVDINEGAKCGYWPADEEPEGVLRPEANVEPTTPDAPFAGEKDTTPF